jgi:aminoglycoside phosphotransferase (APT) family kinase protein
MKTDARDIDEQRLAQALNAEYGLRITSLDFVPKGEDAYVYFGQGADGGGYSSSGGQYFIRAQSAARADPLERVYQVTNALHVRYGLSQVIAPYATRRGAFTIKHDGYRIAVFPLIRGRTLYDQGASNADLAQAASVVAALHQCDAAGDFPQLARETFGDPFKGPVLRALQAAENPVPGAPTFRRRMTRLLQSERADILATLEKIEQLGAKARELTTDWVLTHGDPNLDNLLKDEEGQIFLTDWGEIGVGPPERDMFAFTGEGFAAFLRPYALARTSVALHRDVFAFYFYRWALQEIADYATRILFSSLGPEEDEHAWAELQPYLPIRHDLIAEGLAELQAVLDSVLG